MLVLRDPSPEELEASKAKKDKTAESKEKPKTQRPWVIDRLQFKMDEIGYLDRRRTHLYVFDLAARSLTQITSGDFDDSEPAWSPDSKLLAFSSKSLQARHIAVVPATGGAAKVLTLAFDRMSTVPRFTGWQIHLFHCRRRWHPESLPHPRRWR